MYCSHFSHSKIVSLDQTFGKTTVISYSVLFDKYVNFFWINLITLKRSIIVRYIWKSSIKIHIWKFKFWNSNEKFSIEYSCRSSWRWFSILTRSFQGTIIWPVITCKKFFYKNLLNSAYLWSRARLVINKKNNYFSLPDHQLAENLILVFGFSETTKKEWKETFNYTCKNYG